MEELRLAAGQRRRLEAQLHETTDARVYRRTLAVLEVSRGTPVAEVARALGVTRQSIHNWIDHYSRTYDPQSLVDTVRSGRPTVWRRPLQRLLRSLMGTSPDEWGYWASRWTVPLLCDYLERSTGQHLSEDTVRRELARTGYVWKRSRYVLNPDPDEEKKTENSPQNRQFAAAQRHPGGR